MKIAEGQKPVLNVSEVEALPEFRKLNERQQKFIKLVAAGATPLESVRGAYNCTSRRSGERFLHSLINRPKMQPILNFLYGQSDKDAFLERLEKLLRKGEGVTSREVAALTLFAVVKGYLPSDYSHTAELAKLGKF